jgi:hypothetical protein
MPWLRARLVIESGFKDQQASAVPAPTMESHTARAASQPLAPASVGGPEATAGATGQPAGPLHRHWKGMSKAHLKLALGLVDPGHARFETGAMGFPHFKDLVDPGMDHLVGQGAQGGCPGQGLQQGPRKHDFAEVQPIGPSPPSVEARRSGQSRVTPAQVGHRLPRTHKGTVEMFAVQPVEQGQQGLQGHGIRCSAPLQGKASLGPGGRSGGRKVGSSVRLKPL